MTHLFQKASGMRLNALYGAIILLVIATPRVASGECSGGHCSPNSPYSQLVPPKTACDLALEACGTLVKEQDVSIKMLKAHVQDVENRLVDSQPTSLASKALIFLAGAAALSITYTILH